MKSARLFLLDNHDSFTYNLAQAFQSLGVVVLVRRDSPHLLVELTAFAPTHLVLSPGPQRPEDHPRNQELLARFAGTLPILGVCLGHQAINAFCGGTLTRDARPLHGKTSSVWHDGASVFRGLPSPCTVARYHSLCIDQLGRELDAIAWTEDRAQIMAIQHRHWPLVGVQFHPESFLTPHGAQLLKNFITIGERAC